MTRTGRTKVMLIVKKIQIGEVWKAVFSIQVRTFTNSKNLLGQVKWGLEMSLSSYLRQMRITV